MAFTIFISYSHIDALIVERLRRELLKRGAIIWIDHEKLDAETKDWDALIREGLRAADLVLYIASPSALRSPFVQSEVDIANHFRKQIVPFWVDGESWADVAPLSLLTASYIDARKELFAQALEQLTTKLNIYVP